MKLLTVSKFFCNKSMGYLLKLGNEKYEIHNTFDPGVSNLTMATPSVTSHLTQLSPFKTKSKKTYGPSCSKSG